MITENSENHTVNVEKKELHSNFKPDILYPHKSLTSSKIEITQDQMTCNENLQELHITDETNITSKDLV